MKLQRDLIVPLISCLALACTSSMDDVAETADSLPTSDSGDGDGDGDGDATDTNTGDGDGAPAMPVAMVTGAVTDAAGTPLPNASVQFCGPIDDMGEAQLCLPIPVDDAGTFTIGAMEAALWALKIVHPPEANRYFTGQSFEVVVVDGEDQDFSNPPIVVPEAAMVTDLSGAMGETPVMIDDVLTLNIDPAMATGPDFQPPSEVGGVMVPMEHWRHMDIDGGTVIAAWAFTPFGTHSMDGTSFTYTINDALGLAANDSVSIYGLTKDNGSEYMAATGVVNMDASGIDVTPVGEGLHELSWLFVVQ